MNTSQAALVYEKYLNVYGEELVFSLSVFIFSLYIYINQLIITVIVKESLDH